VIIATPTRRFVPALVAMALSLGACDALTDEGFRGEVLFELSGKVDNRRVIKPSDVNLYLLWGLVEGPNIADQLQIEPTFPANFQLKVF
jgi:hypothetical protein